jgi:hypothetical protein
MMMDIGMLDQESGGWWLDVKDNHLKYTLTATDSETKRKWAITWDAGAPIAVDEVTK